MTIYKTSGLRLWFHRNPRLALLMLLTLGFIVPFTVLFFEVAFRRLF